MMMNKRKSKSNIYVMSVRVNSAKQPNHHTHHLKRSSSIHHHHHHQHTSRHNTDTGIFLRIETSKSFTLNSINFKLIVNSPTA
ncbi:hypothetical protein DERF_005006 [Dermatophagoides farinae]|uniref:Uncharacterized protein n=1 Tax=Dermatophagoides farinae TaxID=6954 RepID=A0A922I3H0_DERFA|nr:hypothetical protein DERF_005006 [Dermatophagoides farinae]